MPERTRTLPLIPLDDAVVLPNMALAVSISTAEARAAIDDALSGDAPAQVVLVTRTDGRFARIGTVAELDGHPAMLPGGVRGITIRALHRAELGRADAAGQALRIEVVEHPDPDDPSEKSQELAHEYRAILEEILEARGNPGVAAFLRSIDAPGALADTAGYSPDLSVERKLELLETLDVEARLEKAIGWAKEALGEIELRRRIRDDVTDGMEKQQREFLLRRQMDAIRKELGDNDGDDIEDLPHAHRGDPALRRGAQGGRARGQPARRRRRQQRRVVVHPHVPRHAARPPLGQVLRGGARRQRGT